ncbi:hypothetical protein QBL02_03725 [Leucobacter sp. UT-8R-CII-1-4]|uniref:hypothetical protein n=1 Tax=Leucobacter sp. UT-8R-CII-1-4 TaxID=3040075 RepID=UPI0024A960E8|nr:hypothetical protein [Leucobacter sp. UT-8R-CII-1-4]MDI6022649.1 hypothetical protein [Leucobacter sp. UT-8R-CII-1-4]
MSEGIRVRIGSDIRFLPETAEQPAAAYASVAKDNWERNADGEISRLEPTWYDAKWSGKQAEVLYAQHQKGDALVLLGNATEQMKTGTDGQERPVRRFFVNAFGNDAAHSNYVLQREQTQQAVSTPTAAPQMNHVDSPQAGRKQVAVPETHASHDLDARVDRWVEHAASYTPSVSNHPATGQAHTAAPQM